MAGGRLALPGTNVRTALVRISEGQVTGDGGPMVAEALCYAGVSSDAIESRREKDPALVLIPRGLVRRGLQMQM